MQFDLSLLITIIIRRRHRIRHALTHSRLFVVFITFAGGRGFMCIPSFQQKKKHYKNPSLVSLIRIGRFLHANLIVSFGPGCPSFHSHLLRLLCCKPNDNISTIVHEYLCSYPFDSNRAWNTVTSLCPALYTILNSFCHSFGVLFRCYLSFILVLCHAFSFYTQ